MKDFQAIKQEHPDMPVTPVAPVINKGIAEVFRNMAALLEMKGDSIFKIRAYQKAARTIEELSFPLEGAVKDGMNLKSIPGIGDAISSKIQELIATGKVATYERLKAELPDAALVLMDVPGVGPKTAMFIAQELGLSTIAEVEKAIEDGRLAALLSIDKETSRSVLQNIHQNIRATRARDRLA